MRGAASSIGIITSFQIQTFAAPDSVTIFQYYWDLSAADAASAIEQFQKFVQGDLPQEFGGELDIQKGSSSGRVSFEFTGGWYAPDNQLAAVIAPFLAALPAPAKQTLTPGTYVDSVQFLGGIGRLDTTTIPDTPNTFYAKSLMIPEESPMSSAALNAFMSYLGDAGFSADSVR